MTSTRAAGTRFTGLLGAGAFAVLGLAGSGLAQHVAPGDPIIIVPQGRHVIIPPRPHPPTAIPVKLTAVNTTVSISDQVAATTLVMTLNNPGGVQQEAQLLVPVPDGASVRAFGLDSLGPEPTAKLLPRDEARSIYNSIVAKARDPGLLEFVGYSLIKSSVFPVPPGGSQTIRLTYEQLLTADGTKNADRVDFILPRTESLEANGVSWAFSADIRSKRPISTVYSPSHEIALERLDPNHITVKLMATSLGQPGSFRLSYLLPRDGDDLAASILFYPDAELSGGKGGYFLLLTGLPAKPAGGGEERGLKREVTLVLDRSGSMREKKIGQAREAALQVIEGLKEGEFFNIIDYSDSINSFSDKPVAKSDATMKKAREYIKAIQASGGTNIHDAVTEALRQEPTPGTLPVVLFLTDGIPTVGMTREAEIKSAAAAANTFHRRIFTFGVGFDVNAPLLMGLARASRAASTFVLPDEDVEVKVGQAFRRLGGPILASPKLTAPGGEGAGLKAIREILPGELPDLFDGDQLIILGQYTGEPAQKLVLSGNFLGKERTFEFSFDPSKATTKNAFVPRLWASRKIAALIEQIRQETADGSSAASDPKHKELVDEIVRLSTKWGILTEYTAFLAVEPGMTGAGKPMEPTPGMYRLSTAAPSGKGGPGLSGGRAMNTDVLNAPAAPAAQAPADEKAHYVFQQRAAKERTGQVGINQEMNLGRMAGQTTENKANRFYDKDLNAIEVTSVLQVHDQTLFKRNNRWVDANLVDKEDQPPEQTIEFASDAYMKLVDDLAANGRQGLLAQGGDCYLLYQGKRTLVKGPEGE